MPSDARNITVSVRDVEALFRSKPISEIRSLESATKQEIESKKEELRLLVGNRYRDLIESADSILLMKSSSQSISSNLSAIDAGLRSLSSFPLETPRLQPNAVRGRNYAVATRVKYLVDTPESIWGYLDGSLFLEASGRYLRAKVVHGTVGGDSIANSPLLRHHWQIIEGFKGQISQRSRERLMDGGLGVGAYADALAAVAIVDQLDPRQALALFLELRRSWISQRVGNAGSDPSVSSVFCDVVKIIQVSIGQVGELFLQVLNDMPLFYKTVLGSPPGTQLFGGVSNPDEEVSLWKLHRERLESVMVMLEPEFIAATCSSWLKNCSKKIVGKNRGGFLIDAVGSGEELGYVEKMIRESLDGREALEASLEWLRSVFGSAIESPWNQIGQLVLKDSRDLWDEIFEDTFVRRMKRVIDLGIEDLSKAANVRDSVRAIAAGSVEQNDFHAHMKRPFTGGGVWFLESNYRNISPGSGFKAVKNENDFSSCLNLYFGPEVNCVRDAVDNKLQTILEDLLCFLESPKSSSRLKELAPYLQDKCYTTISTVLDDLKDEVTHLSTDLGNNSEEEKGSEHPAIAIERALFIGRLLLALQNHSSHIPLILGCPRMWLKTEMRTLLFGRTFSLTKQSKTVFEFDPPMPGSPRRKILDKPRRQTSANAALFAVDDSVNPKLEELNKKFQDFGIKAHCLWIKWASDELALILSDNLERDDALSATALMRGWEETVIKQEQSSEGPLEIKIALPSMPSLYITSFLFQACQEIHGIGGHMLDKVVLQNFVWRLLEKVLGIYSDFISSMKDRVPQVSEKGVLQVLLDLRFTVDILSGGKYSSFSETDSATSLTSKPTHGRKQDRIHLNSNAHEELVMGLIHSLSQRLDPIDWATYEPYLWENERQSYQRHAVLYGFLVQLNRIYMDTVQKLPTNTESNILRCSIVPRFKYLPISAPVLSSRGPPTAASPSSSGDLSSRSSWKAYSGEEITPKLEFDDTTSFPGAAPLFKSFMTQVGRFKDKSSAPMSTFGDMLPMQAAGFLSSFMSGADKSDP